MKKAAFRELDDKVEDGWYMMETDIAVTGGWEIREWKEYSFIHILDGLTLDYSPDGKARKIEPAAGKYAGPLDTKDLARYLNG